MAQYFTQGQKASPPLLLPSQSELQAPYLQHESALKRIAADKQIALMNEQGANKRSSDSMAQALQLGQMQQNTALRGQDITAQQAELDRISQQQAAMANAEKSRQEFMLNSIKQQRQFELDSKKFGLDIEKFNTEVQEKNRKEDLTKQIVEAYKAGDMKTATGLMIQNNPDGAANIIKTTTEARLKVDDNTAKQVQGLIQRILSSDNPEEGLRKHEQDIRTGVPEFEGPITVESARRLELAMGTDPTILRIYDKYSKDTQAANTEKYKSYTDAEDKLTQMGTAISGVIGKDINGPGLGDLGSRAFAKMWDSDNQQHVDYLENLNIAYASAFLQTVPGVKTNFDMEQAKKMFPNINDTAETLIKKYKWMQRAIKLNKSIIEAENKYLAQTRGTGDFVSYWPSSPQYKQAEQEKAALEKEIEGLFPSGANTPEQALQKSNPKSYKNQAINAMKFSNPYLGL